MINADEARLKTEKFWDRVETDKIKWFELNCPETVSLIETSIQSAIDNGKKFCVIDIPINTRNTKVSFSSYLEIMGYKFEYPLQRYAQSAEEILEKVIIFWY